MFIAVAYDIPDDKRRNRLHKKLKDFLLPVQYSVFEGTLDEPQIARMKASVSKIINPNQDMVRFYHLCKGCRRRIELTPMSRITIDPHAIII